MNLDNASVINNRILVLPNKSEEITKGGIILTEEVQERSQLGKAVLIGNDVKFITKNNTVMYGKYAGTEVIINNEKYLIMKEDDILLVYK